MCENGYLELHIIMILLKFRIIENNDKQSTINYKLFKEMESLSNNKKMFLLIKIFHIENLVYDY